MDTCLKSIDDLFVSLDTVLVETESKTSCCDNFLSVVANVVVLTYMALTSMQQVNQGLTWH